MIDRIYTPDELADFVVTSVTAETVSSVADFAAGAGNLVLRAKRRFPEAHFIATDIDRNALRNIKKTEPTISVGSCDFLRESSRERSYLLRRHKKSVSVVLLNPPFSARGGSYEIINFDKSTEIRCSKPMAFVMTALEYMKPEGETIAILPESCLVSAKDADALRFIKNLFSFDVLRGSEPKLFPGYSASWNVVRISKKGDDCRCEESEPHVNSVNGNFVSSEVIIHRGNRQMPYLEAIVTSKGICLIHTTDIINNSVIKKRFIPENSGARCFSGPAVLIPRVGKPDSRKIAVIDRHTLVAVSDCVFALLCRSLRDAHRLKGVLLDNWCGLSSNYKGTGAKYITIERLMSALRAWGISAHCATSRV